MPPEPDLPTPAHPPPSSSNAAAPRPICPVNVDASVSASLSVPAPAPAPAHSSEDGFSPLFVFTGLGIAATAVYVIREVFFANSSSRAVSQSDPDESPSAACALARAWLALDPDPETRAEVQQWLSGHLASKAPSHVSAPPPSSDSSTSTSTSASASASAPTVASATIKKSRSKAPPRPLLNALDPSAASDRLRFGTAGVRAVVGAGYDRLNAVTVLGIANAVAQAMGVRGRVVSVGYDGRHSSRKFALLIAQVFDRADARVRLFSAAVPTPLVAFDGLHNGAACSLVVTASHNPPLDNGVKVYGEDGIQLRPDAAGRVEARMARARATTSARVYEVSDDKVDSTRFVDPLPDARAQYLDAVVPVTRWRSPADNARAPPAVYTACHGVGYDMLGAVLRAFGLPDAIPTPGQVEPDGDFPTLPFPNPEEAGALDAAVQTARSAGARLVLAHDPDADRFAGAELAADRTARLFSGDELAALFADYVTTMLRARHGAAHDLGGYAVVTSAVSSRLLAAMAQSRGFSFHESLTGFKWLNKTALDLQNATPPKTVLLTYEEAIGFNLTRNAVRDKDGLSAAAVFYEMAAHWHAAGTTLTDRLRDILDECGVHIAHNGYLRLSDRSPPAAAIFAAARAAGLPTRAARAIVVSHRDLATGVDTAQPDHKAAFPVDRNAHFLTFRCAKEGAVTDNPPLIVHLRASGTEPKIKFYSELRCSTVEANNGSGKRLLEDAVKSIIDQVLKPQVNHLR